MGLEEIASNWNELETGAKAACAYIGLMAPIGVYAIYDNVKFWYKAFTGKLNEEAVQEMNDNYKNRGVRSTEV